MKDIGVLVKLPNPIFMILSLSKIHRSFEATEKFIIALSSRISYFY